LISWRQAGIFDSANIWVNGGLLGSNLKGLFQLDVTEAARNGSLDIAMEVVSDPKPARWTARSEPYTFINSPNPAP